MIVKVTLAEVLAENPTSMAAVITKLRKGTSRHKLAQPKELEWSYQWALSAESYSFADLQAQVEAGSKVVKEVTDWKAENAVDMVLQRVTCCLMGKIGRWWGHGPVLTTHPTQLRAVIKEYVAERAADLVRPPPSDEDVKKALDQLQRGGGFIGLYVGPRNK